MDQKQIQELLESGKGEVEAREGGSGRVVK